MACTADNASNNNEGFFRACERQAPRGTSLRYSTGRIRCFAHTVNLALKAFLSSVAILDDRNDGIEWEGVTDQFLRDDCVDADNFEDGDEFPEPSIDDLFSVPEEMDNFIIDLDDGDDDPIASLSPGVLVKKVSTYALL